MWHSSFFRGDPRKNDIRKKIEIKLIKHSIKNKVPILGICRGAQALNLFFGVKLKKLQATLEKIMLLKVRFITSI